MVTATGITTSVSVITVTMTVAATVVVTVPVITVTTGRGRRDDAGVPFCAADRRRPSALCARRGRGLIPANAVIVSDHCDHDDHCHHYPCHDDQR